MYKNNYFTSPIYTDGIDIDNEEIKKYCYELRDRQLGRVVSNVGGWQSNNLTAVPAIIIQLITEFESRVNKVHDDLGFKKSMKQRVSECWININSGQSFNNPHVHPGSIFSGVYYVSTCENSGNINFLSPIKSHVYHIDESILENYNEFTSAKFVQVPQESKVIIFPSWLEHYVEPNYSGKDRISIAFNTVIQ
jgi:uncharacterized protein (TIGR02466 family)